MINKDTVKEKLKELPNVPGVYKFLDKNKKIIYVGKAKDLKNRVNSYFSIKLDPTTKTFALVQKIFDIEFIEANTEFESLILEAELIKKFRPKYNINLKDDKSYIYIVIRPEKIDFKGKGEVIHLILTARKTDLKEKDIAFGPYPDSSTAKQIVRGLRRIFPYRDCSAGKFYKYKRLKKPCLFGHMGLCMSPCIMDSKDSLKDYSNMIESIKKLLSGESEKIISDLETEMKIHSKNQDYENAAKYRDALTKFNYVTQDFKSPEDYINNPYLVEDLLKESVSDLVEFLPILSKDPVRIECYDISNISGKDAVGSMVVAVNGRLDKKEYRKFKIKLKDTPDDFEMMREVIRRRLKRELSKSKNISKWGMPDLLIVDGGRGQVSAVLKVTEEFGQSVPVIGIAKKNESLVYKKRKRFYEKVFPKDSRGMELIIKLRNEAHRFAQRYHHDLRIKKIRQ